MELSDGSLRALGILVACRQVQQNSLLIIEEPEVHLHPGATVVLFEALKQASQRGAVLITTHSPELLDAAKDEEILVCDYRSGRTRIGPLDTEQRQIVREGLFSAAELMRTTPLRIEGDAPTTLEPPSTP
jgi:type I restriction enzyme M protein